MSADPQARILSRAEVDAMAEKHHYVPTDRKGVPSGPSIHRWLVNEQDDSCDFCSLVASARTALAPPAEGRVEELERQPVDAVSTHVDPRYADMRTWR